jgi:hypothetical protein
MPVRLIFSDRRHYIREWFHRFASVADAKAALPSDSEFGYIVEGGTGTYVFHSPIWGWEDLRKLDSWNGRK